MFEGYGEGAPSARGLWKPADESYDTSAAALRYGSDGAGAAWAAAVAADAAARAGAGGAGAAADLKLQKELLQQIEMLEERAAAAERRLTEAEEANAQLRASTEVKDSSAELSRRMSLLHEQHEAHHRTLQQRIVTLEANLEHMLLEPLLESSATLEEAQQAAEFAEEQMNLLSERAAAVDDDEARLKVAEQQRAQRSLAELSAEMRATLQAEQANPPPPTGGKNAAAAAQTLSTRLHTLQGVVREWAVKAAHAAADAGLKTTSTMAAEGAPPPPAPLPPSKRAARRKGKGWQGDEDDPPPPPPPPPPTAKAPEDPDSFELEVSLYKLQPDSRLGLTLMGNGCPYVERVAEGGAAFGRLVVGDTILAVNGHQARGHEATTTQLKGLQGVVMLHVRRREQ